jgi:competence/damage-inducible protein CinA-like protein
MKAEIISIGDEIITGHISNTNATWLSKRLLSIGIETPFITAVGDTVANMEAVMQQALRRVDLVIMTGGLGPTDDDLTKRALVKVFRRNLVFHDEVLEDLKSRYSARGITMPEINQNQALLPQGAKFLANKLGSAVGILFEEDHKLCVALPGVPAEMKQIVDDELVPILQKRVGSAVTYSRLIRTCGITESALAEKVAPEIPIPDGVKLAYLAHIYGVDLRLTVNAEKTRLAEELIEQPQGWLKRKLGILVYGEDDQTLQSAVGDLLVEADATVSLAESCTAGLLAGRIAETPGSSRYLDRGFITYSNQSKTELLGVTKKTLETYGAVSAETSEAMALGALQRAKTTYAISITGIAGPDGGSEEKPVGLTYIAIAQTNADSSGAPSVRSRSFHFGQNRDLNRQRAVSAALNLLRLVLLGDDPFDT